MERKVIQRTIPACDIEEFGTIRLSQLKTQLGHCKSEAESIVGHHLKDKEINVSIEPAISEEGVDVYLINMTFDDFETKCEAERRTKWENDNYEKRKEEIKKVLIDNPEYALEIFNIVYKNN